MRLNKSCNSKPSGSNVPVAATRLNCVLSIAQRSAQTYLTKLCLNTSVDGDIHEACNDLTYGAVFVHHPDLRPLLSRAWMGA